MGPIRIPKVSLTLHLCAFWACSGGGAAAGALPIVDAVFYGHFWKCGFPEFGDAAVSQPAMGGIPR